MKNTIFALCALAAGTLSSQNIKYSFSEEFETVKKHADLGFYKFDKNRFVEAYYRKGDDMIFQEYDEQFKNIKAQETVLLPEESDHYGNEGFFSVKNDYFWFYSTWDRDDKIERLFALPFDKNKLKFGTKPVKMVETDKLASVMGYGKYGFNYSTDSTMMLVTYRVKPKERRDKENKDIIGFNLFDHQMKKIYASEIEMPYSEYDMDNLDYEVDSRGNIYALIQVRLNNELDGKENADSKNAYRYELIRVNQKTNTLQAIKIGLDGKYTKSVMLSEDLNHNIVITGYYSDRKLGGVNGAYIIKLVYDENSAVKNLATTYCEFPASVLKAYESERAQRKMDKREAEGNLEAANLHMRNIRFNADGSMLIVGEEYYAITTTYRNGNNTTTTTTYYYNDVLVLKADKDGKTQWACKIPKSQSGRDRDADLGFHLHPYNGKYHFFYLDNVRNAELTLDQTPAHHSSGRGGYLTCVSVDENGKMTKQSVFNIKDEDVRLYPRSFESINDNLIVDRLREGRKTSMVFRLEVR